MALDESPEPDYHSHRDTDAGTNHLIMIASKRMYKKSLAEKNISASYFKLFAPHEVYYFNNLNFIVKEGYNRGRDVGTLDRARELADAVVQRFFPDMVFYVADTKMEVLPGRASIHGGPPDYGYRLYYCRMLSGIPVTPVLQEGAAMAMDNYSYAINYEQLYVDVGQNGVFQINYQNPLRVGKTLQDHVSLLRFSQVLDVFAKVVPLKYAVSESEPNNGIQVNRVVLGYMQLQMKDNPNRYQLVPVWDFIGSRTIGQEYCNETNDSLLTINAIDSTVIDRDYGY